MSKKSIVILFILSWALFSWSMFFAVKAAHKDGKAEGERETIEHFMFHIPPETTEMDILKLPDGGFEVRAGNFEKNGLSFHGVMGAFPDHFLSEPRDNNRSSAINGGAVPATATELWFYLNRRIKRYYKSYQ